MILKLIVKKHSLLDILRNLSDMSGQCCITADPSAISNTCRHMSI